METPLEQRIRESGKAAPSPAVVPSVEQIAPMLAVIAEEAAQGEALGRLTDRVLGVLKEWRLFDLWQPRCFGGLEGGILETLPILE
jgi:hypothetical protein